jgi:hypothetical protein
MEALVELLAFGSLSKAVTRPEIRSIRAIAGMDVPRALQRLGRMRGVRVAALSFQPRQRPS